MSIHELGVSGVSLSGTGSAYTALVGRDQMWELRGSWSDMGSWKGSVDRVPCLVIENWCKKFIYADFNSINTLILRQRHGIS